MVFPRTGWSGNGKMRWRRIRDGEVDVQSRRQGIQVPETRAAKFSWFPPRVILLRAATRFKKGRDQFARLFLRRPMGHKAAREYSVLPVIQGLPRIHCSKPPTRRMFLGPKTPGGRLLRISSPISPVGPNDSSPCKQPQPIRSGLIFHRRAPLDYPFQSPHTVSSF